MNESKISILIPDIRGHAIAFNGEKDELVVTGNRVFIYDYNNTNNRQTLAGDTEFYRPSGVCFQPITNNLLVADMFNDKLKVFDSKDKTKISFIGGEARKDMNAVKAVKCAPNGNIFTCQLNTNDISMSDINGRLLSILESTESKLCFNHPFDLQVLPQSSLLCVSSLWEQSLSIWDIKENKHSKKVKIGCNSYGLCVDLNGLLYCSTSEDTIIILEPKMDFKILGKIGEGGVKAHQLKDPLGLCVDKSNRLLIVDAQNDAIKRYVL